MATPVADIRGKVEDAQPRPLTFSGWVAGVVSRWRMVIVALLGAITMALLALVLIRPVYTAKASFVAISSEGGLKLPTSFGSLGALGGIASQFGLGDAADPSESPAFYNELIASRELRTRLLQSRFRDPRPGGGADSVRLVDLMRIRTRDPERRLELGLRSVQRAVRVVDDDRTNMVFLTVHTEWPELSAAVANRTLTLVENFNHEQRTSRARSRREFLERRAALARAELATAEQRQRTFLEQNRSWRSSPTLVLREEQNRREVDQAATLYLALQQQLEAARIDEVNDAALVTVVDSAVPPRKAAWPRYGLLAMSTLLVGGIFGVMLAGIATVFADWRVRHPQSASELSGALRGVRRDIGSRFRPRRSREPHRRE